MLLKEIGIHRLLTKPVWWWETKRKYPIRDKVFALPPISVNPNPTHSLVVLTTPNSICDAAWAAQSILRYLPAKIGLSIIVDGEIPAQTAKNLQILFPGIILDRTRTLLEELRPTAPNIAKLGECSPVGRKLAIILYLQQKYNIIYSDADILCFNEMPELDRAVMDCHSPAMYIQDVAELKADNYLLQRVKALNYDYAGTLNSGFLYIPQQSLNTSIAEELLDAGEYNPKSWFVEQTILAVLMQQAGAKPLIKSRYIVSTQRQFYFEKDVHYDQIAIRHFINPVRHLMYSQGMPRLLQQIQ